MLDRTVLKEPFIAAVDSDVQWIFDRTDQSGIGSGQYLAVSLSAADELIDVPTAELRREWRRHEVRELLRVELAHLFGR